MKIFVSWSGERSAHVAKSLVDWIPYILPSVEPWISSHDITPGTRWATELLSVLADCHFGVICLTRENLTSPWVLFEAGSLEKQFDLARVVPYLVDLKPADVKFPLAQFQAVEADLKGTRDLLWSINRLLDRPLPEERLSKSFDKWWPELGARLKDAPNHELEGPVRSDREILDELLNISRGQQRPKMSVSMQDVLSDGLAKRLGTRAILYWHDGGMTFEQAKLLCRVFERSGIPAVMTKHREPSPPDAIFIGALVAAEDARLALRSVPYDVKFVFKPDYPAPQGGDDSGLTIGLGYVSSHYQQYRDKTAEPVRVSERTLKRLGEADLSNTEFQALLRKITWGGKGEA